jgi:hypothetical protein
MALTPSGRLSAVEIGNPTNFLRRVCVNFPSTKAVVVCDFHLQSLSHLLTFVQIPSGRGAIPHRRYFHSDMEEPASALGLVLLSYRW